MATGRDREIGPYGAELTSALRKLGCLTGAIDIETKDIEDRLRDPEIRALVTADELDALSAYFAVDLEGLGYLPRKTTNPHTLDELRGIERAAIEQMAARGIPLRRRKPKND